MKKYIYSLLFFAEIAKCNDTIFHSCNFRKPFIEPFLLQKCVILQLNDYMEQGLF